MISELEIFLGNPDEIKQQYNAWAAEVKADVFFAFPAPRGATTGLGGQFALFVFYRREE